MKEGRKEALALLGLHEKGRKKKKSYKTLIYYPALVSVIV